MPRRAKRTWAVATMRMPPAMKAARAAERGRVAGAEVADLLGIMKVGLSPRGGLLGRRLGGERRREVTCILCVGTGRGRGVCTRPNTGWDRAPVVPGDPFRPSSPIFRWTSVPGSGSLDTGRERSPIGSSWPFSSAPDRDRTPVMELADELVSRGPPHLAGRTARDLVRGSGPRSRPRPGVCAAALELGRRVASGEGAARLVLHTPEEVAAYLLPRHGSRPVEVFGLLALDARQGLKHEAVVSHGCLTASLVHPTGGLPGGHHGPSGFHRPVPQSPVRRPRAIARGRRSDASFGGRRKPDGNRSAGPRGPRRGPIRESETKGCAVTRVAWFDGASGLPGT